MRRSLALTALVLSLLVLAPSAHADSTVPTGQPWGGSRVDLPNPATNPAKTTASITGVLSNNGAYFPPPTVGVSFTEPIPGCPPPTDEIAQVSGFDISRGIRTFSATTDLAVTGCNGDFRVGITINPGDVSEVEILDTVLRISLPAPIVSGVTAVAADDGRSVDLSWNDMRSQAADLLGYVVERRVDDGEYTSVATLGADQTSFSDGSLPSDGGTATYQVRSTRAAPDGDGTKVSAASTEASADFVDEPTPTTAPGGGGGSGDGGSGDGGSGSGDGGGGAGGGGGSTPGGSGGGSVGGRRVRAPRLGITGTFLPPLLRPPSSITTTTLDTGYEETLPYGDLDALPADEDASFVLGDDEESQGGMVVPVATGLLLAVWAFHLRYLARASRPTS